MVAFLYRSGKNSKNELKNKPVKSNNGSPEKKKTFEKGRSRLWKRSFSGSICQAWGGCNHQMKCVKLSYFIEVFCPIQLCVIGDDGEIDPTSPVVFAISCSSKKCEKWGLRFPRRNKSPKKLSKNDFRELDGLWERFLSIISLWTLRPFSWNIQKGQKEAEHNKKQNFPH